MHRSSDRPFTSHKYFDFDHLPALFTSSQTFFHSHTTAVLQIHWKKEKKSHKQHMTKRSGAAFYHSVKKSGLCSVRVIGVVVTNMEKYGSTQKAYLHSQL